ncbi:hypothetical protein OG2516_13174 [Oceanicola granulosus HTCC2516]|uniref:DUF2945 domain-containing protein n=1 Tax=Oceanicola granulosus (strain ATCC BAA-861 / DSM 15982 / KCTC 12143 / HTCC2516) TaxID=314256 RepID=Q2CH33_OCEGH|nr:hypothetical protein [Oceanicola granulosus]EAR51978.1 hypothetical protein OG2516_13174 [Oceanicola granulosus HTCC2516]
MGKFSKGDHVSWSSEAWRVSGHEIESDQSDHISAHKEDALTKLRS